MKAIYYVRVFFVSYEFLFLTFSAAAYFFFGDFLREKIFTFSLNEEALKWAMLFPVGIVTWTLKEGVAVLFPDDRTSKILHGWPDYWRVRAHFDVGVLNSIVYLLPCILVWFVGELDNYLGAWLFFVFAIAVSINAFSFYTAKIRIRSELIEKI